MLLQLLSCVSDDGAAKPDDPSGRAVDTAVDPPPDTAETADTAVDTDTGEDTAVDTAIWPDGRATWMGWRPVGEGELNDIGRIVVGDLNGDGLDDLLHCGSDLEWQLNPGTTWLTRTWQTYWEDTEPLGGACTSLDLVDVDADGDLDAVFILDTRGTLDWSPNDGGAFGPPDTLQAELTAGATLAVGDFDGDGRTDLAAAPWVLWNEGGVFTPASAPLTGPTFAAAAVRDDGSATLFAEDGGAVADARRAWSPVAIEVGCIGTPLIGGPIRAGDLTGDGHPDTLVDGISLCAGDGTGALTRVDVLSEGSGTVATELADANGDGLLDFALVRNNATAGSFAVYVGTATGPTLFARLDPDVATRPGGAIWRDLDGDGLSELLGWGADEEQFVWHPNGRDGAFVAPWEASPEGDPDLAATAADLDGDGVNEVVAVAAEGAWMWRATGPRTYGAPAKVSTEVLGSYSTELWPGGIDLDADGDEEILITYPDILVLDWDPGTETLLAFPAYADFGGRSWHVPWAADLDRDGDLELIWENAGNRGGTGDGGEFDEPENIWIGGLQHIGFPSDWMSLTENTGRDTVLALAVGGDVDGDGAADIVTADATGIRVWSWARTEMELRVSTDVPWAAGATDLSHRRGLGLHDVDGDGDLDAWIALTGEAAFQLLLNDGAGGFSLAERVDAPAEAVDERTLRMGPVDGHTMGAWTLQDWGDTLVVHAWSVTREGVSDHGPGAYPFADTMTVRDLDGDGAYDLLGAASWTVHIDWADTEPGP